MAISVGTTTLEGTAATKTGQIIIDGPSSQNQTVYKGSCPLTLDGAATTATINFIDGTQTLPYTPSAVLANIGLQSAGPDGIALVVSTITNTGFSIKLSAAGTNTNVVTVAFIALK